MGDYDKSQAGGDDNGKPTEEEIIQEKLRRAEEEGQGGEGKGGGKGEDDGQDYGKQ